MEAHGDTKERHLLLNKLFYGQQHLCTKLRSYVDVYVLLEE